MGETVTTHVLDFLNFGNMVLNINHTNIVLTPKLKNPEKMFNFKPLVV